jgi:hypothetical protein
MMEKNKLIVDYVCDWNWISKKKENKATISEEIKVDQKDEGKENTTNKIKEETII